MKRTSFKNPHAEDIRLRELYRRLILEGKIRLRYKSLMGLIGPDCAYHLYKFDKENNTVIMCLKSKKGAKKENRKEKGCKEEKEREEIVIKQCAQDSVLTT